MAIFGKDENAGLVMSAKELDREFLPRHVAIIMDGNGRWAQKRGMPRTMGHKAGVEALREIIRYSDELGIEALTIYAFSTENWKRSTEEVGALMRLLLQYFTSEIDELNEKNVRIRILGDIDGMPKGLEKAAGCAARRYSAHPRKHRLAAEYCAELRRSAGNHPCRAETRTACGGRRAFSGGYRP